MVEQKRSTSLDMLPDFKIPSELFWEGDFGEYLEIVKKQPSVLNTAHQRMYEMLNHWGSERTRRLREPIVHYNLFDDPFTINHKHAVYGIDKALMTFASVIRAAAFQFGQESRILLLQGPVGTAKSTIGELLSDGLEAFSRTEDGKMFALTWLADKDDERAQHILGTTDFIDKTKLACPLNGEPLHIIPRELRQHVLTDLLASVAKNHTYPVRISKNACPRCTDIFERFLKEYKGDWKKVLIEHVRVSRILLSRANSVGIAVTRPKSEKDQDATEWSGETNYVALAKYGSISDPRTFDFKGYFEIANRGMLYSEELLKLSQTFLYDYLGASQEGRIQPKGFVEVDIDEVIIGGTNLPEWDKMRDTKEMEALRDRIISIPVPYILRLSDEKRISAKFFVEGDKGMGRHIAPHTIEIASFWSILTRLVKSSRGELSLRDKLKLYDGRQIPGFNEDSVREMMREGSDQKEGLKGISPRYTHDKIANAIVNTFIQDQEKNCVNFFVVLRELKQGLLSHQHIQSETERKAMEELIAQTETELKEILQDEVQQVMIGDDEALREMHQKYLDNILAYKHGETVKNPITGDDEDPDEQYMSGIEQMIKIGAANKDTFREKVLGAMAKRSRERDLDPTLPPFDYNTDERLLKAYQMRLFDQEKDRVNWEALISKKAVGEEAQKRINALREGLMNKKGYCEVCSSEVITYVASIFHRGKTN
jgi:serine protein kinase